MNEVWIAAQLLVLWASCAVMSRFGKKLWQAGERGRVIGQLTTPIALWLMFGVGGVIVMFRSDASRSAYGVNVENADVVLGFSVAMIGALSYGIAFGGVWRRLRLSRPRYQPGMTRSPPSPWPIIALLVLIDLVARGVQVASGGYYAWSTGAGSGGLVVSVLSQISSAAWPILVSLLAYVIVRNLHRFPAIAILSVLLMLDLAIGQRRRFIIVLLLVLVVSMMFSDRHHAGRRLITASLAASMLVLVLFPTIEASRLALRAEVGSQYDGTESLLFVTEYVPAAVTSYLGDGIDGTASPAAATLRLTERVSNWSLYLSSIVHQTLDGYAPQGIETAIYVASSAIPGGDQYVDADRDVFQHYNMGRYGLDAAGSTPADAFAHLHVFGVIIVFALGGTAVGAVAKVLAGRGDLGLVLLVGAIPMLMPFGDSFVAFLVGIRNFIAVMALIAGASWFAQRRSSRSTARSGSLESSVQTESDAVPVNVQVARFRDG